MATILEMVENRLPDEAALFADALGAYIEEAQALAGFDGVDEAGIATLAKSLIADMAAQALILPAMSHYKKALAKAEGDGAGVAEFADRLAFLKEMETKLAASIGEKSARLSGAADTGVPLMVVE